MLFSPFASSSSTTSNTADTPPSADTTKQPKPDHKPAHPRTALLHSHHHHHTNQYYHIVEHNSGSCSAPGHLHSLDSRDRRLSPLEVVVSSGGPAGLKPGGSSLSDSAANRKKVAGAEEGGSKGSSPLSPRTRPLEVGHWQVLGEGRVNTESPWHPVYSQSIRSRDPDQALLRTRNYQGPLFHKQS